MPRVGKRGRALAAALASSLIAVAPRAVAETAGGTAPLVVDAARQAYAFDDPPLLVRQIIFGLAHGVTLLARACLGVGEDLRRPTQAAYEEWLKRHGDRIIDSEQVLARHYFAARAAEAGEDDLARALNLPPRLDLASGSERLREACASFPEALARPRYDLDLVFATHRDQQRLARAAKIRAGVAQCRQIAAADSVPEIDAAFARWQADNAEVEADARARWLTVNGDAAELARWQESIAAATRRRLAAATDSAAACRRLIADLPSAPSTLSTLPTEPAR